MICVFMLFCSLIVNQPTAPLYDGAVAEFAPHYYIAHNTNDGQYFSQIHPGDLIRLYDGDWRDYRVTSILEAQAIPPDSLTPTLMDGTREVEYSEIFYGHDLTLQTCISGGGSLNAGRRFVFAMEE